jgi:ABC-type transport system involved in cytochrome c biogenesis permease subunit
VVESSILWVRVAACLYAVGLLHSILALVRRKQTFYDAALAAFRAGAVLQIVSITELSRAYGHIAVDNVYETLSLCAVLVAIVFLMVERRYHFTSPSVALFPLVFMMTLVAALERPVGTWTDTRVGDVWLVVHVVLVVAGVAALLLTAVVSVFYLLQERRLKSKQAGTLLEKLPPLATLDNLISTSMGVGFGLFTLGVVVGITWAFVQSGTRWIGDAKITFSLFTWVLCLVMIFLRATAGWRGRKAAIMALTVLGCSALTWAAHVGLRPTLLR